MPPSWVSALINISSTGYFFADYPAFLAALTAQYQAIYGVDVYLGPDAQDGQFLAILAKGFYDTAALGASVYNSFSPVTAQGVGLSRNVKINGLSRLSPSFSTVTLTVVGTNGTVITGGVAQDTLLQQWLLPAIVTIPGTGTIDVLAVAANVGAVFADADTVTTIFTPTVGWQTVNNAGAATPGAAIETDAVLRIRQALSTSIPAQTVFAATLGAIANIAGVTKVFGWENFTNTTDAISLPAHSVNFNAVGGDSTAIANAIMDQKTPGTNPVGNTAVSVFDSQGLPVSIHFGVPLTAEIQATVTGAALAGYSSNYAPLIQQAVAAAINALPIGSPIVANTLFVPAYLIGTPAYGTFTITSITIGINSGMQSTTTIVLQKGLQSGVAQNPVCNGAVGGDITVTIS